MVMNNIRLSIHLCSGGMKGLKGRENAGYRMHCTAMNRVDVGDKQKWWVITESEEVIVSKIMKGDIV